MRRFLSKFRRPQANVVSQRPRGTLCCALAAPLYLVFGSNFVGQAWTAAMNWIYRFDRQAWLIVLCGVLAVGAFFLRGFGSRSNY
jgi:hypothetical protein